MQKQPHLGSPVSRRQPRGSGTGTFSEAAGRGVGRRRLHRTPRRLVPKAALPSTQDVALEECRTADVVYSRDKTALDVEAVRELWYVCFGRVSSATAVQHALGLTFTIQAAYVKGENGRELIGLARCLSDHAFAALFADVCVDPRFRQNGIGTELVQRLHRHTMCAGPQGFAAFPNEENWRFLWRCGFRWNRKFLVMTYDPSTC